MEHRSVFERPKFGITNGFHPASYARPSPSCLHLAHIYYVVQVHKDTSTVCWSEITRPLVLLFMKVALLAILFRCWNPPFGAVLVGLCTPVVEFYPSDDVLAKVHNEELVLLVCQEHTECGINIGKSSLLNPI